jgi:hypothetical protein
MIITVLILIKQGMRIQPSIKTYELKMPDTPADIVATGNIYHGTNMSSFAAMNVFFQETGDKKN